MHRWFTLFEKCDTVFSAQVHAVCFGFCSFFPAPLPRPFVSQNVATPGKIVGSNSHVGRSVPDGENLQGMCEKSVADALKTATNPVFGSHHLLQGRSAQPNQPICILHRAARILLRVGKNYDGYWDYSRLAQANSGERGVIYTMAQLEHEGLSLCCARFSRVADHVQG